MVSDTGGAGGAGAAGAAGAVVVVEDDTDAPPAVTAREALARRAHLDPSDVEAVTSLVRRATDADGVAPLSEHVLLHLRRGGEEPGVHLLAHEDGGLVGYAHLDPTDPVEGASAELVVDPRHRRAGHGRRLVETLVALSEELADGRLRLWAHGEAPDAAALAAAMGFTRARELWQMRRSLHAALPRPVVPDDLHVRTFRPDDAEAVLAVNGAAFAEHPEQGRWTRADLDARLAERWFDPAGLFLAFDARPGSDGELLGFHWTKVHGGHDGHDGHDEGHDGEAGHDHSPIGEVYVVGVSPAAQGRGLGRLLTLVGLCHLRARGLDQAMLYVDADNTAAVRTYTSLGFSRWDVDVQFRRDVDGPTTT
ncbi:mycothiol synthase [Aquipuribacter nitratireducens]|uniref:Mycothiol acetyltransferase n=1 Tax=Aquipuribacter nitratireducens TaxID=650104 RepID=A0ABW0GMY2_9MICO